MQSRSTSQNKARLIVLTVFVIGFTAGALSMNLYQRAASSNEEHGPGRGKPPAEYVLDKINQRLSLTSEQHDQIREILENTFGQYREIRRDIEPRMAAVREEGRKRIRALLTPEQLPAFEELLQEQDEMRRQYYENDKKNDATPKK